MKWSLKLGRILGIDVYIHFTFFLLLGFVGLAAWMQDRTAWSAVTAVFFWSALFLCVLMHEYGHALAARKYGIATRDITLLPIGGVARLERMPEKPAQELWVAVAGPLVNVIISAGLVAGLILGGSWHPGGSFNLLQGNFAERMLYVNLFLVAFNLLPAFPMDGGRVLRALLAMRMNHARATNIAATIGQGMALLFGFAGLFLSPMLILIAVFVWIGAGQEAAAAEMRLSLSGARVRDAMLTEFHVLSPDQTIGDASRMLLAGSQQDFPVVDHGVVIGILHRSDLFRGLKEHGESYLVAEAMRRELSAVDPAQPLDSAVAQVNSEHGTTVLALENGRLVGLLTAENIGEYFFIRAALGKRRRQPPPLPTSAPGAPPVIRPTLIPRHGENTAH
jgi:Zn-dependent protease/predicted transcriptional regulator